MCFEIIWENSACCQHNDHFCYNVNFCCYVFFHHTLFKGAGPREKNAALQMATLIVVGLNVKTNNCVFSMKVSSIIQRTFKDCSTLILFCLVCI